MDYSIKVGGEAGQGVQTIGGTLSRIFARSGYHLFTHQDYESRIREGHNFYKIRISDSPIMSARDKTDILVALDRESISRYESELNYHGLTICDSRVLKESYDRACFLDIPFTDISVESGGDKVMANSVAVGSVLGIIGAGTDALFEVFKKTLMEFY